MTSYTKALYRRDPAAAEEFHRNQSFEHKATYGRVPSLPIAGFGRRTPTGVVACETRCAHPACSSGCTLIGRKA